MSVTNEEIKKLKDDKNNRLYQKFNIIESKNSDYKYNVQCWFSTDEEEWYYAGFGKFCKDIGEVNDYINDEMERYVDSHDKEFQLLNNTEHKFLNFVINRFFEIYSINEQLEILSNNGFTEDELLTLGFTKEMIDENEEDNGYEMGE